MANNYKLENIKPYSENKELTNLIWKEVLTWPYLAQKTVGEQLIRATDSIAANIAEGFGRFHKKDKVKFYYNARASAYESAHWIKVACERNLITKETKTRWIEILRKLPIEINTLIKYAMQKLKK